MNAILYKREAMIRSAIIAGTLFVVMLGHWATPTDTHAWHSVHVVLRKMFLVPVILAAIWFNLRGAVAVAVAITGFYLPHIFWQWAGQAYENLNQYSELATVWVISVLAGVLLQRERAALVSRARAHEGALIAMVNALDSREHDTQKHSLRVRAYASRLGKQLKLSKHDLHVLGQAALLHDVGKIGIPDNILLKPGSLSADEWQRMREHPEIGCRILQPVEFLSEAAQIVYAHHEKFDGTGYPRGLAGDAIPLGARIFAVVDVFDALMSARPYKQGMPYDAARQRIIEAGGSHFDPRMVAAFASIWSANGKRLLNEWTNCRRAA